MIPTYLSRLLDHPDDVLVQEQRRVKHLEGHLPSLNRRRRIVVPWSGGMDSTTVLLQALETGADVVTLYVDYGQKYMEKEQAITARLRETIQHALPYTLHTWREHVTVDRRAAAHTVAAALPGAWHHVLPLRNHVVLQEAAILAGQGGEVWVGYVQEETPYSGGDKSILTIIEETRLLASEGVLLVMPIMGMTKSDLVRYAMREEWTYKLLRETVSCLGGNAQTQCGACQACFRRYVAFHAAEKAQDSNVPTHGMQAFIEKYQREIESGAMESPRRVRDTSAAITTLTEA